MAELKLPVSLTNVNGENLSRHDLLKWVNSMVNGNITKIEELCSGWAYCQMMGLIFPNCINLKRVKMNAKLEYECLHNLRLFQDALTQLKFNKAVPIDRLLKSRFQDNFEFLQWFKKFYDTQTCGRENLRLLENNNGPVPKPIRPHRFNKEKEKKAEPLTEKDLEENVYELDKKIAIVEKESSTYYDKLLKIEKLLEREAAQKKNITLCERIFKLLAEPMKQTQLCSDSDIQAPVAK